MRGFLARFVFVKAFVLFFGYGVVIYGIKLNSKKALLNPLFRVKLQTRKPLPLGLLNPGGSGLTT